MNNNASALTGFNGPYYAGPSGTMPGSAAFTAAVLFRPMAVENTVEQTLVDNLDPAAFAGWRLLISGDVTGSVVVTGQRGTGAAVQSDSAPAKQGPLGKLALVHYTVESGVAARLYLNASLMATTGAPVAVPPRVGAPRIGLDLAGGTPAAGCDILGVAYLAGTAMSALQIAQHFDACYRAIDMAARNQLAPSIAWTNRLSVRNGAVVAGSRGTLVGGDLVTSPESAAVWQPSEGAAAFTRTGGVLYANVLTNPVWAFGAV